MDTKKPTVKKCVLAYSGGLDTSIIVPWLRNNYHCEVICFCANLGQTDELDGLEEKALASGASKVYVEDLRAEFLTDYAFPAMQAGAVYERDYLLGTSMARPLIAKRMVEVAEMEGADAVAHGATGKGNDQVRFELTVMALNPRLTIIAPWREWNIRGRKDATRIRRRVQCAGQGHRRPHLQPGPQPLAPEQRGRPAGRPVERTARRYVRVDSLARSRAR